MPSSSTEAGGTRANSGSVYDPDLFRREIWPKLATVGLNEIAKAAGCSKAAASDISQGRERRLLTPHPIPDRTG